MRKLFALLLLACLAIPSFAGAYVEPDEQIIAPIQPIVEIAAPDLPAPAPIRERVIERRVFQAKKPTPASGLAVGFYGQLPSVAYKNDMADLELGVSLRGSGANQVAVRGAGPIYTTADKYTEIKLGLAVFTDQLANRVALSVLAEQYVSDKVSISGELLPVIVGGGQTDYGQAIISGRMYF
jgi:hypothetical protein